MLIFEKSRPGRELSLLPPCDVDEVLPEEKDRRGLALPLPEMSMGRYAPVLRSFHRCLSSR